MFIATDLVLQLLNMHTCIQNAYTTFRSTVKHFYKIHIAGRCKQLL